MKYVCNSPRGCVVGELNTLTVKHPAVVDANIRVVGPNCKLVCVYGVDRETLRLCLGTHVGVEIDQNIVGVVALHHLWTAQVKLPATAR